MSERTANTINYITLRRVYIYIPILRSRSPSRYHRYCCATKLYNVNTAHRVFLINTGAYVFICKLFRVTAESVYA